MDVPTVVPSVSELADPSCYGTTALAVDGWLSDIDVHVSGGERSPSWTIALAGLFDATPTVGDSLFDFLLADHRLGTMLPVVTTPASGIDVLGLGRWVTLTGHFNDPEAAACTVVDPDPDLSEADRNPPCERLFVVTGLSSLAHEAPACPTDSPMTIATFKAADITCFLGRSVQLSGWEDQGEGFGGVSDNLRIDLGSLRGTVAQLVANPWSSDRDHDPIFPFRVAGSGVRFGTSGQRVIVTGGLGSAAAASCGPDTSYSWTWTPPVAWAQNRCARLFVITAVAPAT